ncbi:MAG TPA: DNA-formamidopyrimidine glycosylase family protein [Acidimicrobiia bacterium]|nr:DNA-formamidopyrimidine glycosylase family protein [Acidimicrobiia bacterium]
MPELPDVVVYIEALERFTSGHRLDRIRVVSPSLLRTYDPPLSAVEGRTVEGLRRIGKRIVWDLGEELFVVVHLMVAGRFAWVASGAAIPRKVGLAAFDFEHGSVLLREAATKKRAGLWIVRGEDALAQHDRGGVEPIEATLAEFSEALLRENRTMKRALTDPRILSGIGNAYSDEILHRARLSPVKRTGQLTDEEISRLHEAVRISLTEWIDRLRAEVGDGFPKKVTAFRPDMAVHGRFGEPCPVCGSKVQRIVYADNETNYCAGCQTKGKLLADRSLSRLLKDDWPKTIEDLEESTSR